MRWCIIKTRRTKRTCFPELYKQEFQGIESAGNAIIPEQREIQQLKAQIKRVEMEKEILKQAAVLMSEIPGKLSR